MDLPFDDDDNNVLGLSPSSSPSTPDCGGECPAQGNDSSLLLEGNETRNYLNITTEIPIEYAQPLYGYCVPVLFVITIIANTLVVVVLAKRHMRTPTNAVLMAMAISDMLTVLFPAPWLLYMTIPNFFHTASIWLTLALAVQRYIYVCHAPVARSWCTMPRVLKGITWIYVVAFLHQSTRFFDRVYVTTEIVWEGELRPVCRMEHAQWLNTITLDVYFNVYYWFRVIFIHFIPCVALIVLNFLLFRAMRQAMQKRLQLFKDKKTSESKKMRESNSTTIMLIVVVTVFLLVEVPLAVLTVLHIISSTLFEFLDYYVVNICILFFNFFIIVSYPINFAIYCGMSRQFRETFKDLFVRGGSTAKRNGSSRYSLVNGPRTCTNETVL
ncbi:Sex peptide receptor [Folsomia candida]|uniref:Sex peptide receptor n=1 Tax=Folsomia candida TaxID=158441 RepID=A0A226EVS0_FOLCA|nr:Sex peptide receptor [Folsomia candida]